MNSVSRSTNVWFAAVRSAMVRCGAVAAAGALMALPMTAQTGAKQSAKPDEAAARSASYFHYSLARMYEDLATTNARQDYATQAIEEYKSALDADPESRMLQDGLAGLYFRLGRIREAVSSAQQQVSTHPDDAAAHELLGKIYLRSLGDMQGPQSAQMLQLALKEYETIVRLKPDDLEAHLLLGQLYGLNHDSAKAEAQFKEAQRIDNGSEEVALSIARLYTEQGNLDRAAASLLAIADDDRTARMEFALGNIEDQLHKPHEAAAAYKRSLDQDADNADTRRALAAALTADGQVAEAGKVYGDLVQTNPDDAQSLIAEAANQRQQGHYDAALVTLKKAQAMASENPDLVWNFALTYDALGRTAEAAKTFRDALTAGEHSDGNYNDSERSIRAAFLDRLALIERERGNTTAAIATYKQLAALGGENGKHAAEAEVDAYRDAHQWSAATAVAADAAKAAPADHELQLAYARQLADAGKLDEGVKLAEAQRNGTPDDRDVAITLADMYIRAHRWKDAALEIDKAEALAAKPDDKVMVFFYRGTMNERQKMYAAAEAAFRQVLMIDPSNLATENYLGYMLADRGIKLPEAVAMLQKAVTADPQNGAYLDSLGWAYFKSGQAAIAEETLRKAVARTPTDPTVRDHLGEVYARNGKLKLAIAEWQRSLAEYATSLPPEAEPEEVAKVEHKLEGARTRLAQVTSTHGK